MFIQLYSLHLNSLRFKNFFFSLEWQGLTLDIYSSHNSQRDTWCYMEHQAYQGHDPIRVTSLLQERHCSFSYPGGKKKREISIICDFIQLFLHYHWCLVLQRIIVSHENYWIIELLPLSLVIVNYRPLRQLTGHCKHEKCLHFKHKKWHCKHLKWFAIGNLTAKPLLNRYGLLINHG